MTGGILQTINTRKTGAVLKDLGGPDLERPNLQEDPGLDHLRIDLEDLLTEALELKENVQGLLITLEVLKDHDRGRMLDPPEGNASLWITLVFIYLI